MRIYFIGSHSSGKSSLTKICAKQHKLPMITECARKVLSDKEMNLDNIRHDVEQINDYQFQVFKRQLMEEENFNNIEKSFVSDRSAIDCAAYSAQHSQILPNIISDFSWEPYIQSLKEKDVIIFFVRSSKVTLKEDGVREAVSWDGVVAIDAMIKLLLQMYNLRYFTINTDSMQERIQLVDAVLSLHNH